jgi:hypothetical protein
MRRIVAPLLSSPFPAQLCSAIVIAEDHMERNKHKPHHLAGPSSAETQELLDDVVPVEHTTTKTAREKCPKCPRIVTSVYQAGNKKFYNHGEGSSINWKDGQTFDLKFADYCTVEIGAESKEKARAGK